jgi:hypothetical protein
VLAPILGTAICAVLLTQVDFSKSLILLATVGAACANWVVVRDSKRAAPPMRGASAQADADGK